jgi:hypothetical protein
MTSHKALGQNLKLELMKPAVGTSVILEKKNEYQDIVEGSAPCE